MLKSMFQTIKRSLRTNKKARLVKESLEHIKYFANLDNTKTTVLGRYISRFSVTLVVDVGGNVGQFGVDLRRVGYKGKIISFEPNLNIFSKLKSNAEKDGNWFCINSALGSRTEELFLNVASNDGLSSSLKTTLSSPQVPEIFFETVSKQKVAVNTLDDFQSDFRAHNSILLKIDTQGFEHEVLLGGRRAMSNISCILVEVSYVKQYENQYDIFSLFELLNEFDFTLFDVFQHGYINGTQVEGDLFFVKKDMLIR